MEILTNLTKLILTSLLSVAALFIITKLMGHKQVAQLDFFDYVSGITIGSIGAELATELDEPYKPLIALAVYGGVSIIFTALSLRFASVRKYINGTPTILMNDGKIYRKNLRKAKLDLSEFLLMLRELGYFDLGEVECAIFEHNGKLSILPRAQNRPATPKDLEIQVEDAHVYTELIMDGRILGENLGRIGQSEEWLKKQITSRGYKSAREILLATYLESPETLRIYPIE